MLKKKNTLSTIIINCHSCLITFCSKDNATNLALNVHFSISFYIWYKRGYPKWNFLVMMKHSGLPRVYSTPTCAWVSSREGMCELAKKLGSSWYYCYYILLNVKNNKSWNLCELRLEVYTDYFGYKISRETIKEKALQFWITKYIPLKKHLHQSFPLLLILV